MKIVFLLCAAGVLLVACNNNKPADAGKGGITVKTEDGKEKVSVSLGEMAKWGEEMERRSTEMKKLTPLSTDAMKSLLPETLAGIPRSEFNVVNSMGYAVGTATYKINDTADIQLAISDCAGEMGAGFFAMTFGLGMNVQSENDKGYTKTIEMNGQRAIESYEKYNNKYQLTFMGTDRFVVNMESENIPLEKMKEAAAALDYEKMKAAK
jgi:hypothetical protein